MRCLAQVTTLMILTLCAAKVRAQDTRAVTEPHVPPTCATLTARLAASGGVLPAEDERMLDTQRIQHAMDTCKAGESVVLRADGNHRMFLSGPLTLRSDTTLVIDAGAALVASRDPRVYDITPGSCGVVSAKGHGCKPLIAADNADNSGIMGDGVIDGRGGAALLSQKVTWWDLAHTVKVTDKNQSVPWLIVVHHARNFTLYNITLRNSPGFHVAVDDTDGFTAWGVRIMTPETARNTDGIDPGSSRNVTITHCFIHAGDDDVAVKSGKPGPSSDISILHNHFYTGHGMSIGSGTSGGVSRMLVQDLTIDGADNGIRIKSDRSRGGLVQGVTYRDVCMRDVKNPLVFTPNYADTSGDELPVYRGITLDNVHVLTAGHDTFLGIDAAHKLELTLNNVFLDDQAGSTIHAGNAVFIIGSRRGNLLPSGEDVTIRHSPEPSVGTPFACAARFVPFPALATDLKSAGTAPAVDQTLYVAADGSGDFSSIQSALNSAPPTGALILVAPGTYREVLTVNKPNIRLRGIGKDAAQTVVVMGKSAGDSGGTLYSATVNVTADNFLAEDITFQNNFNAAHSQLPRGSQALALLVSGDRAVFRNVRLLGNQDTVYAGSKSCSGSGADRACIPARQYFYRCYIAGNVDFLFGDGKTVFDHCELHSNAHSEGFITAQSKSYPMEDSGYVIYHSRLTADPGVSNVWLGRPWRPYATVAYLHTRMGNQIVPAGWREWHPGQTHSLDTAFYAEYRSSGPGADHAQRNPHTHFLSAEQAKQYNPSVFLRGSDNWKPLSPCRHSSGAP